MSSKTIKTRKRILQAAWDLLETKQGSAARMSDIAKAAGISRQALYLHFDARADLLEATTRYIDEVKDIDQRLVASRTAPTGVARLHAFIETWGNYIPEIYGVGRALMADQDTDEAAAKAWQGRMDAVRHGCAAAIHAVNRDGGLLKGLSVEDATDMLWMLLSVRNWEQLRHASGWSQEKYISQLKQMADRLFVTK